MPHSNANCLLSQNDINVGCFLLPEQGSVQVSKKYMSCDLGSKEATDIKIKYKLQISRSRLFAKLNKDHGESELCAMVNSVKLDVKTCMTIYGNGGGSRLPAASRASRFFGYVFNEITLDNPCKDELNEHHEYEIGDALEILDDKSVIKGKIVALFWKKRQKGLVYPAVRLCSCTGQ